MSRDLRNDKIKAKRGNRKISLIFVRPTVRPAEILNFLNLPIRKVITVK